MRIGIDARFWGPIGKGLGRYTQKLLENIGRLDEENEYFVFLRKENFASFPDDIPNFHKVLADFHWYTLEEQIKFPRLLESFKLDLVHFPHFNVPIFYRGKFVVTIHDLILLHFPTVRNTTLNPLIYRIKFFFYKKVIKTALSRSERIITVSNFTKKDILAEFPEISGEKIIVTYESAENFCFIPSVSKEEILSRYGIIKPYLLYVGNAYPHKNLERLLSAFQRIKKNFSDLNLVLVGKRDYFYSRLESFARERGIAGVIFTGFVSDEDLDTVFKESLIYVWPSLYEGFGLPPLEAMAKGIPVLSSDEPCMREILEDGATYFDGRNVADIEKKAMELIRNEERRREKIEKGYAQAGKYDWKKMGEETLRVYQEILEKRG